MSSVIVVGGGKIGAHLASLLLEGGHRVGLVEQSEARLERLRARFPAEVVNPGSGTEAATLETAGIRGCDVVAAVTGSDETNLVVCALARFEFGVPRVIARIVDPANAWMYADDMGVDVAFNQADLLAHLVSEEMSLGEMTTLLKLRRGQFSLIEEKVDPDSGVVGRTYGEIAWPPQCRIVAVLRQDDLLTVTSDLVFAPLDVVLAVVHTQTAPDLARMLDRPG